MREIRSLQSPARSSSRAEGDAPGLRPGGPTPAFELAGVDGARHSLESLLAPDRTLALRFCRSGNR